MNGDNHIKQKMFSEGKKLECIKILRRRPGSNPPDINWFQTADTGKTLPDIAGSNIACIIMIL